MSSKEYIYDNSGSVVDGPQYRYLINNLIYHRFVGEVTDALKYFPESIGARYNIIYEQHKYNPQCRPPRVKDSMIWQNRVRNDILSVVVYDTTEKYRHLMNSEKNCVIHLRLGDAFAPYFMQIGYAPFKETIVNEYVQKHVPSDYCIDIIHLPFTALCSESFNPDKSRVSFKKETINYVNNLVGLLNGKYSKINILNESHPDIDLCRMVNADIFVADKGGFTNIARSLREYKGLVTVSIPETSARIK